MLEECCARSSGRPVIRMTGNSGRSDTAKRVIELAGPREYSPRDVAAALADAVGKPIAVQEAPEDAMEPALAAAGMNAEWTRLFKELIHGLNTGIVVWEGGHPLWRGETDIQTVLSALLGK
jgi:NAD(P)H dehydrogenase (quinone)